MTAHVGFWAIFFLLLSTAGFHALLRLEAGWCQRFKLDLAFALLWAMVLTILVVRLILSYRIALLPPENATAGEITFVFHKSFVASFWALAVLPLSLLAARLLFMERWNLFARQSDSDQSSIDMPQGIDAGDRLLAEITALGEADRLVVSINLLGQVFLGDVDGIGGPTGLDSAYLDGLACAFRNFRTS